ncbi:MAG: YncE family protein [Acidobacteriota bacterium]
MKKQLLLVLAGAVVGMAAGPGYKVIDKIKIGGTGTFWDYVFVDADAGRLYVSHSNQVEVIDTKTRKLIGTVTDTPRVHGIAVAGDLNKGFTSNGGSNNVRVFDLKTLMSTATIPTGMNPDAILYDSSTHRVFAFNGNSKDVTIIDAKTDKVITTVPVGGKPEFSQADGKGKVYFNVEDTAELVELDAAKGTITRRMKLTPCDDPTGLALDRGKNRLFVACSNKLAAVVDAKAWKLLATVPIGTGADGIALDGGRAFTSNGGDGTMTVIGEEGGKWVVEETVDTLRSARTIGADAKAHVLYLPAAENGPPAVGKDGKAKGRGPIQADTFQILVVGK